VFFKIKKALRCAVFPDYVFLQLLKENGVKT
jgi:hypothetical protein